MELDVHESGSSIYSDVDIVLYSIDLWSVGDIYMEESWFILFKLSSDSFSSLLSLSNESPRLQVVVDATTRKDDGVGFEIVFYLRNSVICGLVEIVEQVEIIELMGTMWANRC
jgi:hypothetical protein